MNREQLKQAMVDKATKSGPPRRDDKDSLMHKAYDYLLRSFQARELGWVKTASWTSEDVPVSKIEVDDKLVNHKLVAKMKKKWEGTKKPHPIMLMATEDGKFGIADGRHRTLGAIAAGHKSVPAWVARPIHKKLPVKKITVMETEHGKKRHAGYQQPEY